LFVNLQLIKVFPLLVESYLLEFSKPLNHIQVEWKLHLNLYETSLNTGPVL